MLLLTTALGILMLLAAYAAGLTETRIGTAAAASIVLLLAISGLPSVHFLFDSAGGWLLTLALWIATSEFYFRLLAELSRPRHLVTPSPCHLIRPRTANAARYRMVGWQLGGLRMALAWEVAA